MDKITVHKYTPDNKAEWEDFVENSNNGTMFHKQAFLDYHPDGRFPFLPRVPFFYYSNIS